jgi:hypothetical protein
MSTIVVPVYLSQLDAFKEKADLLADKIKQSLNIKVSKFKRYEYLARGIGHVKGHDRLIENAKLIAQADKYESLVLFSDPVICNQIGTVFKFHHNQDIAREVQEICKELGTHEVIMANTTSHLLLSDDMSFYATEEYKELRQLAIGGVSNVLQPNSFLEREHFFEELSVDMAQQVVTNLRKQLPKLDKRTPEQWCIDMAFELGVPQQRSADFLKVERGITVELLPDPDFEMSITNPDGSDVLCLDHSLLNITEEQSTKIRYWLHTEHNEGTFFDSKLTELINVFLTDTLNKSDLKLNRTYETITPLKDINFELLGNQLKIPNKYFKLD